MSLIGLLSCKLARVVFARLPSGKWFCVGILELRIRSYSGLFSRRRLEVAILQLHLEVVSLLRLKVPRCTEVVEANGCDQTWKCILLYLQQNTDAHRSELGNCQCGYFAASNDTYLCRCSCAVTLKQMCDEKKRKQRLGGEVCKDMRVIRRVVMIAVCVTVSSFHEKAGTGNERCS